MTEIPEPIYPTTNEPEKPWVKPRPAFGKLIGTPWGITTITIAEPGDAISTDELVRFFTHTLPDQVASGSGEDDVHDKAAAVADLAAVAKLQDMVMVSLTGLWKPRPADGAPSVRSADVQLSLTTAASILRLKMRE